MNRLCQITTLWEEIWMWIGEDDLKTLQSLTLSCKTVFEAMQQLPLRFDLILEEPITYQELRKGALNRWNVAGLRVNMQNQELRAFLSCWSVMKNVQVLVVQNLSARHTLALGQRDRFGAILDKLPRLRQVEIFFQSTLSLDVRPAILNSLLDRLDRYERLSTNLLACPPISSDVVSEWITKAYKMKESKFMAMSVLRCLIAYNTLQQVLPVPGRYRQLVQEERKCVNAMLEIALVQSDLNRVHNLEALLMGFEISKLFALEMVLEQFSSPCLEIESVELEEWKHFVPTNAPTTSESSASSQSVLNPSNDSLFPERLNDPEYTKVLVSQFWLRLQYRFHKSRAETFMNECVNCFHDLKNCQLDTTFFWVFQNALRHRLDHQEAMPAILEGLATLMSKPEVLKSAAVHNVFPELALAFMDCGLHARRLEDSAREASSQQHEEFNDENLAANANGSATTSRHRLGSKHVNGLAAAPFYWIPGLCKLFKSSLECHVTKCDLPLALVGVCCRLDSLLCGDEELLSNQLILFRKLDPEISILDVKRSAFVSIRMITELACSLVQARSWRQPSSCGMGGSVFAHILEIACQYYPGIAVEKFYQDVTIAATALYLENVQSGCLTGREELLDTVFSCVEELGEEYLYVAGNLAIRLANQSRKGSPVHYFTMIKVALERMEFDLVSSTNLLYLLFSTVKPIPVSTEEVAYLQECTIFLFDSFDRHQQFGLLEASLDLLARLVTNLPFGVHQMHALQQHLYAGIEHSAKHLSTFLSRDRIRYLFRCTKAVYAGKTTH